MKKEITVPGTSQKPLVNAQSQSSSASNDGTARERDTRVESEPISEKVKGFKWR